MNNRHVEEEVLAYLKIMPAVLIIGPRQSGKTTLVEMLAKKHKMASYTFDDDLTLSNAKRDPFGWIDSLPKPVVIDEIQRAPEVFLAIKRDIDQNRKTGRYILTGSANPLLLPKLGDSLAGRMGIVNMFPFSQGEICKTVETFIPMVFSKTIPFHEYPKLSQNDLVNLILRGGFPPVQSFETTQDIHRWMKSYLQAMLERDVRDIANIEGLREFPRLFRILATRSGCILNMADISRSLGMVHMTLNRYIRLLETLYFIHLLPGWFSNHGKRLTKSPKIYTLDTGILSYLLDADVDKLNDHIGAFFETFVFTELLKQQSFSKHPFEIYHYREKDFEVDFVLEQPDGSITGIEVKTTFNINTTDLRGLKRLKSIAKKRFKRGIILHQGTKIQTLGDDLYAIPIQALWH